MNMKRYILPILITMLLITSCSHRVVRTGYGNNKQTYYNCNVTVKKSDYPDNNNAVKVGEVKLGDTGFSVVCNENDAIELLKKEACSVGANLVIITDEKRPDLISSCYRCKAILYRTEDIQNTETDQKYEQYEVNQRVKKDRKNNTVVIVGSVILGFTLGFFMFSM